MSDTDLIISLADGTSQKLVGAVGLMGVDTPEDPPVDPPADPPAGLIDFTPVMTGATTGVWTAAATSQYSESGITGSAWRALTAGNASTWQDRWCSAAQASVSVPQKWSISSSSPFSIKAIGLVCRPDANTLQPTVIKVFDDTGALLYDTGATPLLWTPGEEKKFVFVTAKTVSRIDVRCDGSGALCSFKAKLYR